MSHPASSRQGAPLGEGFLPHFVGGIHKPKSLLFSPYPDVPPYVVRTPHPGMTDDREHITSQRASSTASHCGAKTWPDERTGQFASHRPERSGNQYLSGMLLPMKTAYLHGAKIFVVYPKSPCRRPRKQNERKWHDDHGALKRCRQVNTVNSTNFCSDDRS